jgi:hypothetical protein
MILYTLQTRQGLLDKDDFCFVSNNNFEHKRLLIHYSSFSKTKTPPSELEEVMRSIERQSHLHELLGGVSISSANAIRLELKLYNLRSTFSDDNGRTRDLAVKFLFESNFDCKADCFIHFEAKNSLLTIKLFKKIKESTLSSSKRKRDWTLKPWSEVVQTITMTRYCDISPWGEAVVSTSKVHLRYYTN